MRIFFAVLVIVLLMVCSFISCAPFVDKGTRVSDESTLVSDANAPISYTEEDKIYYERYAEKLWNCPEYDNCEVQTYGSVHRLFAYVSVVFDGVEETSYCNKDTGEATVPLYLITTTMEKYFGKTFEEVFKQDPAYDPTEQVMRWSSFGGFGGASLSYPAPIRREKDVVVIPYYWYNDQNQIRDAREFWIQEEKDGFKIIKIVQLTEQQILDLNNQYFGNK